MDARALSAKRDEIIAERDRGRRRKLWRTSDEERYRARLRLNAYYLGRALFGHLIYGPEAARTLLVRGFT